MVIVELIASISFVFAFLSAIVFAIVHMKNKRKTFFKFIHHRSSNNDTRQQLPIVEVIKNDEIESISMKYGIQWINPTETIIKSIDYEQGDSVSFSDQTMSVRELIVKFENDIKEKNYQTESDVTSLETKFDDRTIKNQMKFSHHSSISNLDVTIPSNLSSTIDLERFECISMTSNLSEFLTTN